jgi:uncharacterized cupin superfamily protein
MPASPKPPALDPFSITGEERQPYPAPYNTELKGKTRRAIGDALGLTKIGVGLTELAPGAVSALRHWHAEEDEFVYIVSGELTLVTNEGAQVLRAGMVAGFPCGKADGHRLENRSTGKGSYIEISNRSGREHVEYPDSDLQLDRDAASRTWKHRDGKPY